MLVVTGATGVVGGHAARLLAAAGRRVRVLARDPAKLAGLSGAEIVQTHFGDPAGLASGLRRGDVVFMVSLNLPQEERVPLHSGFIQAAAAAQVAHLVYLSFIGAAPGAQFLHARSHWETEALIRRSGVPFTFLRTSFYDVVTTMFYLNNGLALGPGGNGRVGWVSRPDCGAAVAAVMLAPDAHAGNTYDIVGPQALSLAETSTLITRLTGLPYRYVDGDYDPAELAKTVPVPEQFLRYRRSAFLGIAAGQFAAANGGDLAALTGTPGTSLGDFIGQNRGAYPVPPRRDDGGE